MPMNNDSDTSMQSTRRCEEDSLHDGLVWVVTNRRDDRITFGTVLYKKNGYKCVVLCLVLHYGFMDSTHSRSV